MDYILAVFSNRTETITFSQMLKSNRVAHDVISTPSGLGVSCNVSIKFSPSQMRRVVQVFRRNNFLSFSGFYKPISNSRGRTTYERQYVQVS